MIITIYDYKNAKKEITIPDKEIAEIFVIVVSGDETGYVKFADGEQISFDASDTRVEDYYDGCYCVKDENIQEWINFTPSGNRAFSYERQDYFGGMI